MGVFDFLKKPMKNIDDFREMVENKIALGLIKIRGNKAVDSVEVLISNAVMTAIEAYIGKEIPPEVKAKVNEGVIKGCDVANELIVKQLEK